MKHVMFIMMPALVGIIGYLLGYEYGVAGLIPALTLGYFVGKYTRKWAEEE